MGHSETEVQNEPTMVTDQLDSSSETGTGTNWDHLRTFALVGVSQVLTNLSNGFNPEMSFRQFSACSSAN